MSASLLVFVPVALFFIVSGLCFVGCLLDSSGFPLTPFTTYSGTDVLGNPSIVAYWSLSEPSSTVDEPVATAIAVDTAGTIAGTPHNGNYTHKDNALALFPCPAFQVSATGPIDSAAAIGSLTLGVTGIVPGDALQPLNNAAVRTTAMQTDGAFVTVPFAAAINPPVFTVECWVRPDAVDLPAVRAIVDSRTVNGGAIEGFVLWVNEAGNWEAVVNGTGGGVAIATAGAAMLSVTTYVALTFDGTNVSVFTDGMRTSPVTPLPAGSTYSPNSSGPLIIGAGMPWLPPRTQPSDNAFFPLMPFKGTIQDVAIYNAVLSDALIDTHRSHGNGVDPTPP